MATFNTQLVSLDTTPSVFVYNTNSQSVTCSNGTSGTGGSVEIGEWGSIGRYSKTNRGSRTVSVTLPSSGRYVRFTSNSVDRNNGSTSSALSVTAGGASPYISGGTSYSVTDTPNSDSTLGITVAMRYLRIS